MIKFKNLEAFRQAINEVHESGFLMGMEAQRSLLGETKNEKLFDAAKALCDCWKKNNVRRSELGEEGVRLWDVVRNMVEDQPEGN